MLRSIQVTIFFILQQQMTNIYPYMCFCCKNTVSIKWKWKPQFLTFNISKLLTFIDFFFDWPFNFYKTLFLTLLVECKLCGWHFYEKVCFLLSATESYHLQKNYFFITFILSLTLISEIFNSVGNVILKISTIVENCVICLWNIIFDLAQASYWIFRFFAKTSENLEN